MLLNKFILVHLNDNLDKFNLLVFMVRYAVRIFRYSTPSFIGFNLDHIHCEVATSLIARHKKPRHDFIVVSHLKSCGVAEKSLRGFLRRAIIEVATPRSDSKQDCEDASDRFNADFMYETAFSLN